MTKLLASLRYGVIVPVICSFVSAVLMLYVGAVKVFKAIKLYATGEANIIYSGSGQAMVLEHLTPEDATIARLIESMDSFLISLVLIYFSFGMYALFLMDEKRKADNIFPVRLIPVSIGQLKETLARLIIVVLFVLFTRMVWLHLDDLHWEMLILPAAIVLLSLALKFANLKEEGGCEYDK